MAERNHEKAAVSPAGAKLEVLELAATPDGYRLRVGFDAHIAWFEVQERQLARDPQDGTLTTRWFYLSSVAICYPASLRVARQVVENHLALYNQPLAETLGPVWATWETAPTPQSEPMTPPEGSRLAN
jgi:hypothetical protein